jgi:hypothetical protein
VKPDGPDDLSEVWFAGVHSDVGGTFVDDSCLSTIALKWMTDQALRAGLILKQKAYAKACTVDLDHALGTVHRMGWFWALLTYRRRPLPAGVRLHRSVRDRMEADPSYRLRRTPPDDAWDDDRWTQPSPLAS